MAELNHRPAPPSRPGATPAPGGGCLGSQGELYRNRTQPIKPGNYLGSWLAQRSAQVCGAREAILVNSQGHWLETATGNLWVGDRAVV
jgi:branched-subunit amino acid aminotransferase/4-amino-4-deoxychorismate lyase